MKARRKYIIRENSSGYRKNKTIFFCKRQQKKSRENSYNRKHVSEEIETLN